MQPACRLSAQSEFGMPGAALACLGALWALVMLRKFAQAGALLEKWTEAAKSAPRIAANQEVQNKSRYRAMHGGRSTSKLWSVEKSLFDVTCCQPQYLCCSFVARLFVMAACFTVASAVGDVCPHCRGVIPGCQGADSCPLVAELAQNVQVFESGNVGECPTVVHSLPASIRCVFTPALCAKPSSGSPRHRTAAPRLIWLIMIFTLLQPRLCAHVGSVTVRNGRRYSSSLPVRRMSRTPQI